LNIIRTIGVVGAGQMGSGIAQVFAAAGYQVTLCDQSEAALEKGLSVIRSGLNRLVQKEKIDAQQADTTLQKINVISQLEGLASCDLVIEAIIEDTAIKTGLFQKLDQICKPDALLASNTSSISITLLAAATQRPTQVIGMHFMNPVPVMKLVEVIRAVQTSDSTHSTVMAVSEAIGKTPQSVADSSGFVANRILIPMINEAIFCRYENLASVDAIDSVMTLGTNQPMGPLALADLIGLDTCLSIMQVLYDGFNDPKYRPCPLLKQMVDAGYLGRKSGRGFYQYHY